MSQADTSPTMLTASYHTFRRFVIEPMMQDSLSKQRKDLDTQNVVIDRLRKVADMRM